MVKVVQVEQGALVAKAMALVRAIQEEKVVVGVEEDFVVQVMMEVKAVQVEKVVVLVEGV